MADRLVLVNGLPGSGKTTLACALGTDLLATVLSKDVVKEALAEAGAGGAAGNLGATAMDEVWARAERTSGVVVVDSYWFAPRDLGHARAALARVRPATAVEVWCDVPAEVARRRYGGRSRHSVHRDQERLQSDWASWANAAVPLALTAVVRVDTCRSVDVGALAEEVRVALQPAFGSADPS